MMNALESSSTRPYLIRALYEWCCDNGFTPYLAVLVDDSVQVPREYVKNGEIVLNISHDATSALKMGNDYIEFKARFAGTAREIMVPVSRVLAIYARENGQGMAFPVPSGPAAAGAAPDAAAANPAVSATAAPLGAGVLAEMAGDKPMLKIYFDVSRAQVAPEFAKVAADLVAYVKEHPEAKLSISGFNDPTGNAAQNAKLAKQRAQAVQSALKAQGIAANRMLLSKPADAAAAAAAGANNAELRRVEVRLQ